MDFCPSCLQSESVKYFLDNLDRIGQLVSRTDEFVLQQLRSSSPPSTCLPSVLSELHPEQAGYLVREEGDEGHRGARLRHQEDPVQDGGRRRAAVAEAEVVPVFRRHHVDPLHGVVVGVRPGTSARSRNEAAQMLRDGSDRRVFIPPDCRGYETDEQHQTDEHWRSAQRCLCGWLRKRDCSLDCGSGSNKQSYDDD